MSQLQQAGPGRPRDRIAARIGGFVLLSCFSSAFIVSWVSIQSAHSSLRRGIERSYPQVLERAAGSVRGWLDAGLAELESLAGSLEARPGAGPDPGVEARLEAALERSSHFRGLAVLARDGSPLVTAGPDPAADWADGGPLPSHPQLRAGPPSRLTGRVPWPAGPTPGLALAGRFRLDALTELLAQERPGPEVRLLLLDAAGFLAARTPPAPDEPPEPPTPLPLEHFPPGSAVGEYKGAAGDHVVGAAAPLGRLGWHLALEVPFERAFAPLLGAAARILGIDLCVILLFSALAYRRAAALAKPIEDLAAGAQRIAAGELEVDVPEVASQDEIALLTRAFRDMTARLRCDRDRERETHHSLREANRDLRRANRILAQLSITDGLTKLHNHRFFQDHLTREIKRVQRMDEPLSMLLVDIDDFKGLNDRFGHAAGDEVLTRLARIMDENVRESDLLARYGGEEFVVLLPDTDSQGAFYLAEKVRTAIAEASFPLGDSLRATRLSVSIGVAQYRGHRRRFFVNADRALYSAKAQGKNCVVVHQED